MDYFKQHFQNCKEYYEQKGFDVDGIYKFYCKECGKSLSHDEEEFAEFVGQDMDDTSFCNDCVDAAAAYAKAEALKHLPGLIYAQALLTNLEKFNYKNKKSPLDELSSRVKLFKDFLKENGGSDE